MAHVRFGSRPPSWPQNEVNVLIDSATSIYYSPRHSLDSGKPFFLDSPRRSTARLQARAATVTFPLSSVELAPTAGSSSLASRLAGVHADAAALGPRNAACPALVLCTIGPHTAGTHLVDRIEPPTRAPTLRLTLTVPAPAQVQRTLEGELRGPPTRLRGHLCHNINAPRCRARRSRLPERQNARPHAPRSPCPLTSASTLRAGVRFIARVWAR